MYALAILGVQQYGGDEVLSGRVQELEVIPVNFDGACRQCHMKTAFVYPPLRKSPHLAVPQRFLLLHDDTALTPHVIFSNPSP